MRTRQRLQGDGGAVVLARGVGALAALTAAAMLSLAACATPSDTETEAGAVQAAGYVYSGGSWGSTERLSRTGGPAYVYSGGSWGSTERPDAEPYVPMSCVPTWAYSSTDGYDPMGCVPPGSYGADEGTDEGEAYVPLCDLPEGSYSGG